MVIVGVTNGVESLERKHSMIKYVFMKKKKMKILIRTEDRKTSISIKRNRVEFFKENIK
ncbi:hypothetical protein [Clostridium estertheticum]|uniref:hypothetical protein n=1 Tax=Clostridium estertheticum TaxID=238834 RepID=UPI00129C27C4|nr:hypothetical protein [Clostridium estertheticum]